jgi:hypothetical protein
MLDLPELLAPASNVRGRISIRCFAMIDLKPWTISDVIAGGVFGESPVSPFRLDILRQAFHSVERDVTRLIIARVLPTGKRDAVDPIPL